MVVKMNSKATITLENLLDKYYSKEEISNILYNLGEKVSGQKSDLIYRLLESNRVRTISVSESAKLLLNYLSNLEIKNVCSDLGLPHTKHKNENINIIIQNTYFEPFVKEDERFCATCAKNTINELHFDQNWQFDYFLCKVCLSKTTPIKQGKGSENETISTMRATPQITINAQNVVTASSFENTQITQSVIKEGNKSKTLEIGLGLFAAILAMSCLFSVPLLGWLYGAVVGIIVSIISTLVIMRLLEKYNLYNIIKIY